MITRLALIGLEAPQAIPYLKCLRKMPEVRPTIVVEAQVDLLQDQDELLSGVKTFPHFRNMLKEVSVDGVIVCGASSRRWETIVGCARAGKSILCENPISRDSVEAHQILAICQAHDVLLGVCFPVRWSPFHKDLRQSISEGKLGELQTVKVLEARQVSKSDSSCTSWFADRAIMRLGTIFIDTLRWLFNSEFTRVMVASAGESVDSTPYDCIPLQLEMSNGVAITLGINMSAFLVPGKEFRDFWVEIAGSQGRVSFNLFKGVSSDNLDIERLDDSGISESKVVDSMLSNFVQAIHGRESISAAGIDGVKALEVFEAARKACGSERIVTLL